MSQISIGSIMILQILIASFYFNIEALDGLGPPGENIPPANYSDDN